MGLRQLAGCIGLMMIATNTFADPTLREAAGNDLLIGAAIVTNDLDNPRIAALLATQYSSVSPGNELKPDYLQKVEGRFTFAKGDRLAEFAIAHNQKFVGHTLCWHQQSPKWMFADTDGKPLPREKAMANLKSHITTVVSHFRGRIVGWDVVNEAISDAKDGDALRDTPARKAIGDDYIEQAFRFAHEADPNVELYYNDYNIETQPKRDRTIALIRKLKAAGVRIDAVGIQGHWSLAYPKLKDIEDAIVAFKAEGVKVMLTELDIDVLPRAKQGADLSAIEASGANPYVNGCPPEVLEKQAQRYSELFTMFNRHRDALTRVTFWGVSDAGTWLNNFPVRGRTNHPLLHDRNLAPKPAYDAVLKALQTKP